jgi:hypothetical protein
MDTSYEWIGFLLATLVALTVSAFAFDRWRTLWPFGLVMAGAIVRVLGATVRYEVLFNFYRGGGDSVQYFRESWALAEALRAMEITPFGADLWVLAGERWGTGFITSLSGLVLAVLGPSLRGEFVIFSFFAFGGLVAMAVAFARVQYRRRLVFAAWIWFFPSLWFWPSSLGKESVLLLAMGLATLGYVGDGKSINWFALATGIALAFLVRPHVAAVLGLAVLAAQWLARWETFTPRRIAESAAALVGAVVLLIAMSDNLGTQRPEADSLQGLLEWQRDQTLQGGSNIGSVPLSVTGIPMAFVNIWMRPFVWEAHNLTALVAAAEITAFWFLVIWRRREVMQALRHWRQHRLLRFALPLLLGYTVMIGVAFGNLGLIARQRTLVFPFMLMLVLAVPALQEARAPQRLRLPPGEADTVGAG